MNWFRNIKLQHKDTFPHLLQSRVINDSLHNTANIVKDLSQKLYNKYNSNFSDNIGSSDKNNTSGLCSPQSLCNLLFSMLKSSKVDRELIAQMIENEAAKHPMEMNLPLYDRQGSFIESIVSWIYNTKHLSPRDIKLAINILKHEDSINQKSTNATNATPVNNKISYIIKDLLINKYTGSDWYQMISSDKKIKIALDIDDNASKIIDLCFQKYQKFNQKDILNVITSNIDNLCVSQKNINAVYNHIKENKNYDGTEISFFMDLLKHLSNKRIQLSDDLVSKVCKLLFQVYKSAHMHAELKQHAIKTIKNLVDIYPKALSYHIDNTQQSFIDVIISSVKHSAPKKVMLQNSTQDKRKYDDKAKFFINLIQTSIKNNSDFSSNEGGKIIELLFKMYNSSKTSTIVHDNSVLVLQKFIAQHANLATIPLSHSKCSIGQLIAKSIEKKGQAVKINDAQLATSIISNIDGDTHTKRTLLELLMKNYKYADRYKVLKDVIDAASPKELNLVDEDGNTFGHFLVEQYQQHSTRHLYDIKLMQRILKSNKLNITAQNDKGETILHALNLNSYDDRILALDILKNANNVADLYCLVDKNGNKFIANIIKSFLNGNNDLNEIINRALNAYPDGFLSVLADMCNSSNLPKYSEIINIIKEYNNAEDVNLYCTKFLKHLSKKNTEVAYVAENYLMQHLYVTEDPSARNYDRHDENHSPVDRIQSSAPEEYYFSSNIYPNLGEIMPHNIEVYG